MSVRRATQQNLPFPAIDINSPPFRKSGIVWSAGQVQISKDGGAFVNTVSLPVEIGSSGRYYVTLTAAETDAIWVMVKIERLDIQPWDVTLATGGHPSATVVADGANTATIFRTTLTQLTADFWRDCLLLFTSGPLLGQVRKVVAYNQSTAAITVASAFTGSPSSGDYFVLVNY